MIEGLDAVVIAALPRADDRLYRTLVGQYADVRLAGDAIAPRGVEQAVCDGQELARAI